MYLFFDTETNGLPRDFSAPASDTDNWPRIVQLAWVLSDEQGQELDKRDFIVRPEGFHIPPDAVTIHGITEEIAMREGVALDDALKSFNASLEISDCLVAHNTEFDQRVIASEYLRCGRETIRLMSTPSICTMRGSTAYCAIPGGKKGHKWPKLNELHVKLFGRDFEGAHNALSDVEACKKCFFELRNQGVFDDGAPIENDDDEDNGLIGEIYELADQVTWFDTSFVDSVNQQHEQHGFITDKQRASLIRIRDMLESKT